MRRARGARRCGDVVDVLRDELGDECRTKHIVTRGPAVVRVEGEPTVLWGTL
jgi:hypothetical protein